MNPNLHELHRRRLEATVRLVEEALSRGELLLREKGRQGIVRTVENSIPQEERLALLNELRQLRSALRGFAGRFALDQHRLDIRQVLDAEFSSVRVMLENCRPQRMKGYGVPFDEESKAKLEESVDQLLSLIVEILRGVQG